jgi:hypothetical protein
MCKVFILNEFDDKIIIFSHEKLGFVIVINFREQLNKNFSFQANKFLKNNIILFEKIEFLISF